MQQNSQDIESWLRLIRAKDVGPKTFARLIEEFGSPEEVLAVNPGRLEQVKGIGKKTASNILRSADEFDVEEELEKAANRDIYLIHLDDPRYPAHLKAIYDPPPILYIKGDITREDNLAVAIVGSRRASYYGTEQASRFAHLLASSGFTIVSGMARGIDTAAHRGALSAGGRTLAIQGCGLGKLFPPENASLFKEISQNGACISELPIDIDPKPENFPARNRIIAGLTMATLVIEAGERSGAMITARCAMESDRDVLAVPGKIDSPLSKGPHKLIKQGAKLVDSIDDIMETLGYIGRQLKSHVRKESQKAQDKIEQPLFDMADLKLTGDEKLIYDFLKRDALHLEQIISVTDLPAGKINASLISLRLKGLIKQLPGNHFKKA